MRSGEYTDKEKGRFVGLEECSCCQAHGERLNDLDMASGQTVASYIGYLGRFASNHICHAKLGRGKRVMV
jgi:hypothetical protein